jgi:hypothetical protein
MKKEGTSHSLLSRGVKGREREDFSPCGALLVTRNTFPAKENNVHEKLVS